MDIKQIKDLMAYMEKMGVKKVRIKEEKGFEVEIERDGIHPPPPPARAEVAHALPPAPAIPQMGAQEEPVKGEHIVSPMVGTFYSAASPDDPAYVKVGDEVEEDTVVCIIEAMKVMNEVKAGKKGKIAEVVVANADPVEFGTKLFRII